MQDCFFTLCNSVFVTSHSTYSIVHSPKEKERKEGKVTRVLGLISNWSIYRFKNVTHQLLSFGFSFNYLAHKFQNVCNFTLRLEYFDLVLERKSRLKVET